MKLATFVTFGILLQIAAMGECQACTDFVVRSKDSAVVNARSMEWATDLHSRVVVHPRGEQVTSAGVKGKPGLSWTSKFGYIGVDVAGLDAIVDGMNEKGLSLGELWLPEYTKYPAVPPEKAGGAIDISDLGRYVLGNFATVSEAKDAILRATISGEAQPSFGGVPTVHIALHDATGESVVIEWLNGETRIYSNANGVLTNAPPFEWQLINLKNYIGLTAENPHPLPAPSGVLSPTGQGSGFFGIPGDWTPPSRFVRTSAMLKYADPAVNAADAINLAQHALNAVDIPHGDIRETQGNTVLSDYTQWAVVKDLTNSKFYFRSYDNLNMKMVDLKKIDFSEGKSVRRMDINSDFTTTDVTGSFRQE